MTMTSARTARVAAAVLVAAVVAACSLPGLDGDGDEADPQSGPDGPVGDTWQEQAEAIEGIEVVDPGTLSADHVEGSYSYDRVPPIGGPHNGRWQDCTGLVYDAPIASEHAVHSMEHGAVWVTYHPSLPADQVTQLADMVDGTDYTMLSPFEDLDAPASAQAWGYRVTTEDATDGRIEEFIRVLRLNAGPEAGVATCGGPNSVATTGTEPVG